MLHCRAKTAAFYKRCWWARNEESPAYDSRRPSRLVTQPTLNRSAVYPVVPTSAPAAGNRAEPWGIPKEGVTKAGGLQHNGTIDSHYNMIGYRGWINLPARPCNISSRHLRAPPLGSRHRRAALNRSENNRRASDADEASLKHALVSMRVKSRRGVTYHVVVLTTHDIRTASSTTEANNVDRVAPDADECVNALDNDAQEPEKEASGRILRL